MTRRQLKKRRLSLQTLETRRVLAASMGWDGPGLGSAELTYSIGNSPDSLSQSQVQSAVETALDVWSAAADINFVQTSQSGLNDSLDITFTNIDGPGGTIAQAYLPDDVNRSRIAGDIQFDAAEVWEVGNSLGSRAFDLVWVAVHEIGHALGLDHTQAAGSVLAPFVSPNQQFVSLSSSDASAIGDLYAAADDTAPVDTNTVVTLDDAVTNTTEDTSNETDTPAENDSDNRWFQRRGWGRWWGWGRFGGRLEADVPAFHNLYNPTDVNDDGDTTAVDALTIINQIASGAEGESSGPMCDTTGDGVVTAMDALLVINRISTGDVDSTPVSDTPTDDSTVVAEIDDTATDTDSVGDDDETDEEDSDDQQGDDPVIIVDTEDPEDDTQDSDDDEETDDADGMDDEHCMRGGLDHRHHGHGIGLKLRDPEQWLTRFDANEDGSLSEDEVPGFVWEYLVDQEVDSNGDGAVTLEELQSAVDAARLERFNELDASGDGLLQEDEVSSRRWRKISAADTDGDMGVSMDELDIWRENRISEWNHGDPDASDMDPGVDQVFAQIGRKIPEGRSWGGCGC